METKIRVECKERNCMFTPEVIHVFKEYIAFECVPLLCPESNDCLSKEGRIINFKEETE